MDPCYGMEWEIQAIKLDVPQVLCADNDIGKSSAECSSYCTKHQVKCHVHGLSNVAQSAIEM